MLDFIKNLFHKHDVVVTSRKLIKRYKAPVCGDLELFNTYLNKGYCMKCKQKLVFKSDIMSDFDLVQPYDK